MTNTSKTLIALGSIATTLLVIQRMRFSLMLPKLDEYVDLVRRGKEPDSKKFSGVKNDLMNGVIYRATVTMFPFSKSIILKERITNNYSGKNALPLP